MPMPSVNVCVHVLTDQEAGSDVFAGTHCENTFPALEDLIRRDNAGELPSGALVYVEFDVHVSWQPFQKPPRLPHCWQ